MDYKKDGCVIAECVGMFFKNSWLASQPEWIKEEDNKQSSEAEEILGDRGTEEFDWLVESPEAVCG